MMGISAVDNALWDLRGRYYSTPVYRLLGGPTRKEVDVYGSCLGHSVEPERMRATAAEFKKQGFRGQKWFTPAGPGDGPAGLQKNVDMVRILMSAVDVVRSLPRVLVSDTVGFIKNLPHGLVASSS